MLGCNSVSVIGARIVLFACFSELVSHLLPEGKQKHVEGSTQVSLSVCGRIQSGSLTLDVTFMSKRTILLPGVPSPSSSSVLTKMNDTLHAQASGAQCLRWFC